MSLLRNPDKTARTILEVLWERAHEKSALESDVLSFWDYYFTKIEFADMCWLYGAEVSPEPGSRRRIVRSVRYVSPAREVVVLLWIEGKRGASESERKECEGQALRACQETLRSHPWQSDIYVLTTLRTKAKAWMFNRAWKELAPMFDEHYIEAHSNEAQQLSKSFEKMKRFGPGPVHANPQVHIPSAPIHHQGPASRGAVAATYQPTTAYNAPIQTYQPKTAYNAPIQAYQPATAYGASYLGDVETPPNPIFDRKPADRVTQAALPTRPADIWIGYTHVGVRRDPRGGEKGLVYRDKNDRYRPFGTLSQGEKDGKQIIYNSEKKIWFSADKMVKKP